MTPFGKGGPERLAVYQPSDSDRLCCIGTPGEGKSVYRAFYTRNIYRITLFNQMGDYNVGETIEGADEYRERMDNFRRGVLRVTVVPSSYDPEAMREEYDAVCAYVYEVGAMHFATEEIATVEDPRLVSPNFNMLCIKGRHRAVSMSWYGQRFHQFPLIARGTSSEIVAFRQTDPDDVRDFNKRIGPSVSPVPLNHLPKHHYIHFTRESGAVFCRPLDFDGPFEEYQQKEDIDIPSLDVFEDEDDFVSAA